MPNINVSLIAQKLILWFCIAISLFACNSVSKPKQPASTFLPSAIASIHPINSQNSYSVESNGKNYFVSFALTDVEEKLPVNRYFDLQVQVKGTMQQDLKFPLQLAFDAGMNSHNHGMNVKPKIETLGHGNYLIKGVLLHMSGQWFFEFNLRRGVMSDKAKIDVMVML